MKRITSFFTMICVFISVSVFAERAYSSKDLIGLDRAEIRLKSDSEVKQKFGNLYIAYTKTGLSFVSATGRKIETLKFYFIYYIKDNDEVILGKIEPVKVFNAYGKILKEINNPAITIYGISSSVIESPLAPNCVTMGSRNEYTETESFVRLYFDFQRASIIVRKWP